MSLWVKIEDDKEFQSKKWISSTWKWAMFHFKFCFSYYLKYVFFLLAFLCSHVLLPILWEFTIAIDIEHHAAAVTLEKARDTKNVSTQIKSDWGSCRKSNIWLLRLNLKDKKRGFDVSHLMRKHYIYKNILHNYVRENILK